MPLPLLLAVPLSITLLHLRAQRSLSARLEEDVDQPPVAREQRVALPPLPTLRMDVTTLPLHRPAGREGRAEVGDGEPEEVMPRA